VERGRGSRFQFSELLSASRFSFSLSNSSVSLSSRLRSCLLRLSCSIVVQGLAGSGFSSIHSKAFVRAFSRSLIPVSSTNPSSCPIMRKRSNPSVSDCPVCLISRVPVFWFLHASTAVPGSSTGFQFSGKSTLYQALSVYEFLCYFFGFFVHLVGVVDVASLDYTYSSEVPATTAVILFAFDVDFPD